jgi:single-strand DNA-binding protein
MDSFRLTAVGNLAKAPELTKTKKATYVKFALIGNDWAGKDKDEVQTTIFFVAFGPIAEAIEKNARIGDQLIVDACVRANNYKDEDGELQYGYSFIVQGFRFGAPGKAKREEFRQAS